MNSLFDYADEQECWLATGIRNYVMRKKFEALFAKVEPAYAKRNAAERSDGKARLGKVVRLVSVAAAAVFVFASGFYFGEKSAAPQPMAQVPSNSNQPEEHRVGALETTPTYSQIIPWASLDQVPGNLRPATPKDSVALVFFKNSSPNLAYAFHDKLLEIYLPARLCEQATAASGAPVAADFDGDGAWDAGFALLAGSEARFFKTETARPAFFRLLEVGGDKRQLFFQVNNSFFYVEETKDKKTLSALTDETLKARLNR